MGKRSDFERIDKDRYPTPIDAVRPLIPHLPQVFTYVEPCADDNRLVRHISELAPQSRCIGSFDIQPASPDVQERDALTLTRADFQSPPNFIITNPPWSRDRKSGYLLHRMIETFVEIAPTWLLFDADWIHTEQSNPYTSRWLTTIVSIGRVKWIPGTTMTGKDNCCWHLFDKNARSHSPFPVIHTRRKK